MKTTFIYALCEPGTRTVRYIGKSNDPKRRLRSHLSTSAKENNHLGHWLSNVLSRGEKPSLAFLCEIPEETWSVEETRYILAARMLGMNLVNGNEGGRGGHNPSLEARKNMSKSQLGKRQSAAHCAKKSIAMSGENNFNFGKPRSAEVCKKISDKTRGTKLGEQNHFFGKKHLEKTLVLLRKPKTEEHKQNMRKPKSEAGKANMRKPKTEAHKAALSLSALRRHLNKT